MIPFSPGDSVLLIQRSLYDAVSSIRKICWFRNQSVEAGLIPLTIILRDSLGKFVLLILVVLGCFSLKGGIFPRHTARALLNYTLIIATLILHASLESDQNASGSILVRVIDTFHK